MTYRVAPLFCRPWTLNGISPRLIESHYEHEYGSAVHRLNAVTQELEALDARRTSPDVVHRLKRDELELLNSVQLHELYFASLGGDGRAVPASMERALTRDFGSVGRWRDQFAAMAAALAGGSGWVLLSHVPRAGRARTLRPRSLRSPPRSHRPRTRGPADSPCSARSAVRGAR
jgi:Fe-Mn family superoxide dismutase